MKVTNPRGKKSELLISYPRENPCPGKRPLRAIQWERLRQESHLVGCHKSHTQEKPEECNHCGKPERHTSLYITGFIWKNPLAWDQGGGTFSWNSPLDRHHSGFHMEKEPDEGSECGGFTLGVQIGVRVNIYYVQKQIHRSK